MTTPENITRKCYEWPRACDHPDDLACLNAAKGVQMRADPCSSCGTSRAVCDAEPGWACCVECDRKPTPSTHGVAS